jgi:hypothetical protein
MRKLTGFVAILVSVCIALPAQEPPKTSAEGETLTVRHIFHITGVPGIGRNTRGDLLLTGKDLIFQKNNKNLLVLPYERIRLVQFLSGERHYPEATYAMAVAFGFVGALMILKKRKVDALVVDFVNERGGRMGMVLQLPLGQGGLCREKLTSGGVKVEEPAVPPSEPAKKP